MFSTIKKFAFRKFKKLEIELHELNYLFWECTTRCNLNCLHCGSDCSKDSSFPDMPIDDFLKAMIPLAEDNTERDRWLFQLENNSTHIR